MPVTLVLLALEKMLVFHAGGDASNQKLSAKEGEAVHLIAQKGQPHCRGFAELLIRLV